MPLEDYERRDMVFQWLVSKHCIILDAIYLFTLNDLTASFTNANLIVLIW
jgi:hypothetical protein